jgi:cadmium resistance transport/sequestration family protein
MSLPALIGLGIAVFVSTNIDDIFVLMLFFADTKFSTGQVILGQFVGIGLLIAVSVVGALVALSIPAGIIGLMGLLPIGIGVKKLLDLRRANGDEAQEDILSLRPSANGLRFVTVATVTIANGGDNIGVYVPLFATSTTGEIVALVIVWLLLVAVWCWAGYALVNRSFLGDTIRRVGDRLLPFVLIGLGVYILAEAFLLGG